MLSKERMKSAMMLRAPDRVPVMCQLAIGHYFLHAGMTATDIWYRSESFSGALVKMQQRYHFDGILVNLPGREPDYESYIQRIEQTDGESTLTWKNGNYTAFPIDDLPHYYQADGARYFPTFDELDPEKLFYVEPWDLTDITYPYTWGFETEPRPFDDFFPDYHFETIRKVLATAGDDVSVHSEIFSPWSQFLELLNYENALMAIFDDPGKVRACLERLTQGAIDLAIKQASLGVDAVLISSAFAGAGFISTQHYREFVLPYEKKIISEVRKQCAIPVYTHTCGSIGDRLNLMVETGTNGIDTLDPPPIGTVDLEEAKQHLQGKTFIKGNIDPVNTLLYGSLDDIRKDVAWRIEIGKQDGGYILSTACSVAPSTPPENIELLHELVEEFGRY